MESIEQLMVTNINQKADEIENLSLELENAIKVKIIFISLYFQPWFLNFFL